MKEFSLKVLGCKVNAYEAESVATLLEESGYHRSLEKDSDITIIWTCAVTNTAAQKSRQMMHRARRNHPDGVIVLAGCYSQLDQSVLDDADIIIGTKDKSKIPTYLDAYFKNQKKIIHVEELEDIPFEDISVPSFPEQVRAYLKVEDGCNQFCSYCIIPYARGRERSLALDRVLVHAKSLAKDHSEIVLSGIHTGRYGREYGLTLADLLEQLLKETKDVRYRISSIEITEIDDHLIHLLKTEPRVAKHLHIPLQSGSNEILKAMNRPYTKEEFYERLTEIRNELKDISISTDLIVGFPGESEELFEETYDFLKKCEFSFLHVFPFSKRSGTVAEKLPHQLDEKTKKERVSKCTSLSKELFKIYQNRFIGSSLEVIVEQIKEGYSLGYSSEYIPVKIPQVLKIGTFQKVEAKECKDECIIGRVI